MKTSTLWSDAVRRTARSCLFGSLLIVLLGIAAAATASAQIIINDPTVLQQEVVTVRAVDPYASEPGILTVVDDGKFLISRCRYTNEDQTVFFKISGTAQPGVDYNLLTPSPTSIVIPAGRWSVEVPVHALFDKDVEGVETVVLALQPPMCIMIYPPPPTCYVVGQPAGAVVYIRDSSPPDAPPNVKINEPFENQVFQSPTNILIKSTVVDPDGFCYRAEFFDGSVKIGEQSIATLVMPPPGTPAYFDFLWKDVPPGRHTLTVRAMDSRGNLGISAPVHIAVEPLPLRPAEVSVVASEPLAVEGTNCWGWWNTTNPLPAGMVEYTSTVAGSLRPIWWFTNCGPKNGTFTIRRTGPTNDDLLVFFRLRGSATNGVDYEPLGNSATIKAGQRKVDLMVVPIDDQVREAPETAVLELMLPPYMNPLPSPYIIAWPPRAGVVIVDSSRPRPPIGPLADRSFFLGGSAPDGAWYRLERSSNLVDWVTLCTNRVILGTLNYVDPEAEGASTGFYRASQVEAPTE